MSSPNYPFANFNSSAAATSQVVDLGSQKFIGIASTSVLNSTAITFKMALSANATQLNTIANTTGGTYSINATLTNTYYGFSTSDMQLMEGVRYIQVVGSTLEAKGTNIALVVLPRDI